jgi:hypothetical protein
MALTGCGWFAPVAGASNLRTQKLVLHQGWNSVFLEVNPLNFDPAVVFAKTPVSIVATFFALDKNVQFIQDPASTGWNKESWAVWYAKDRSDAFLSNLHAIHGNRAFLILAKEDFTWTITGTSGFQPIRWKGDSFNLIGFGVDELSPPTFDQFFAPSAAHHPYRIYRLVNGQWTPVSDAGSTQIRSGEAYWMYCKGGSDYQGPLRAKLMVGNGIEFGKSTESWISFANESSNPMTIQVHTVPGTSGLPLAYTIRGISDGAMLPIDSPLPANYSLPVLEAGDSTSFWLKLRREKMTNPTQTTLLKITTDNGVQLWVTVKGNNPDLTSAH